jgi:hypothetical protein
MFWDLIVKRSICDTEIHACVGSSLIFDQRFSCLMFSASLMGMMPLGMITVQTKVEYCYIFAQI